jgi:hypothetical protein
MSWRWRSGKAVDLDMMNDVIQIVGIQIIAKHSFMRCEKGDIDRA